MIEIIDIAISKHCRRAGKQQTKSLSDLINMADCGEALAFIMSVISHNVEDAHFDEYFVGKGNRNPNVADRCGLRPTKKNGKS